MKKFSPDRAEKIVFALITVINLIPFLTVKFFPSLDGASHMMNANIINQIIVLNNNLFQQFFSINPELIPNWTSHFVLALLQLVMPAFLAEKILITGLVAGLPLVFRKTVRRISPENLFPSYFIFPFTHSLFLFFGFFNFCLAVIFLLLSLDLWLKYEHAKLSVKSFLNLFLLVLLTYFSHILVFGILMLLLTIRVAAGFVRDRKISAKNQATFAVRLKRRLLLLAAIVLLPLAFSLYFFFSRPSTHETAYLPLKELLAYLGDIRPLISFDQVKESKPTIALLILLLSFPVCACVQWLFLKRSPEEARRNHWWLALSAGVLLLLYFVIPNSYGTASFTSLRLLFLAFILGILWLSALELPKWFSITTAAVAVCLNLSLLLICNPVIRDYSRIAATCNKAADFIEPNSLVLPINCSDNWFTSHFLDYVAIDKPILFVYNYEAETGYFPVVWNDNRRPGFFTGNLAKQGNYHLFRANKVRPALRIGYIFILGTLKLKEDDFFTKLPRMLAEEFKIVYRTDLCTLYQSK